MDKILVGNGVQWGGGVGGLVFYVWAVGQQKNNTMKALMLSVCFLGAKPLITPSIWHKDEKQGTFCLHKYLSHYCGQKELQNKKKSFQLILLLIDPKVYH